MNARDDDYAWWRAALADENPPIHLNEIHCGYFKIRDRRGVNKDLAPIKRPFIAAAIWKDQQGQYQAEMAGAPVEQIEEVFLYWARNPIAFEDYQYWHKHECWPEAKEDQ